jgi:serine/threonine protein kinase
MGDVYLAEDPRIRQHVAIKVMRGEQQPPPHTPSAQTAARLFEREARAIVALDHPHILPLHDYGEEQQGKTTLIYLVMPYRPEGSLGDCVQQSYPDRLVPPGVVAHLISQAAEALQYAHERQITHSDVKPANFLVRANPQTPTLPDLLLADFGIARIATATASTSQAIRGTPTYMAPEQCEGEAVPASDQYALAVMTYELLAGQPPFQGTVTRLMYQHVTTPPKPPRALNPRLSSEIDAVLLTALAKRPEDHFRSVRALEIRKEEIHKRQAWENLIETNFNLQRRLADFHFAQVTSWEGAKQEHERWMSSHNEQPHWAHCHREDGLRTPAEVLHQVQGKVWSSERLHRIFFTRRFPRWLDRQGYARFRRWHPYGEVGLARKPATLWLYGKTLTVEYANTPLTQYTVAFQPDQKRFREVKTLARFETQYRSPQLELWGLEEVQWLLARRLPEYARRQRAPLAAPAVQQLPLFADG